MSETTITCLPKGPYKVDGVEKIVDENGQELPIQKTVYLCRCGASSKKPFCDGSHKKVGFGEESPS